MMPLSMTSKVVAPTDRQRALVDDLQYLIEKHDKLSTMEVLALASQMVGMIIAKQPAGMSPTLITEVVRTNVELGNAAAVAALRDVRAAGNA